MTPSADPSVLGRLLVLQGSLQAAPDSGRLGEQVCYVLADIPGTASASFYLDQQLAAQHPKESGEMWPPSRKTASERIAAAPSRHACISLQTRKADYGCIVLSLSDPDVFRPYLPHIENTANLIALMLEIRDQDETLHSINANLEEQVRERVNSALESEKKYRLLFENMTTGFALHEMVYDETGRAVDYRYLDINPAFERLTGVKVETLLGKTVREVMPGTEDYWIRTFARVAESGEPIAYQNYARELGRHYDVWAFSPQKGRFAVIFTDITARVNAENALRKSEQRLAMALIATNSGIWDWNPKTGDLFFDATYFTMAGYEKDEFPHRSEEWLKRIHPDDIEGVKVILAAYMAGETDAYSVEFRFRRKDGSWMWILAQGKIFERDEQGNPVRFTGTHTDVTERKRIESALLRSRQRLSEAAEIAHVGHWDWNIMDGSLEWTDEVFRIFGFEPGGVTPSFEFFASLVHEDDLPGLSAAVAASQREAIPYSVEFRFRRQDGSLRHGHAIGYTSFDDDGKPFRMSGAMIDVTERKRAEENRLNLEKQMLHTQKLESLGVLAGGIAHDFNNLLMAILGNLDLAAMKLSPVSPAKENLDQAAQASKRAADLTRQMLAYSGRGRFVVGNLNLSELVEENAHLLKASISKLATLHLRIDHGVPPIEADAGQIQQIVMNLITNASEALGNRAGVITLTTGAAECDSSCLKGNRVDVIPPPGLFVFLEVTDTGCGMDPDTLNRIFEPFFTTKFTGRGLGMSAILGIVRGHHGAILVDSAPGKGTAIRILFPAVHSAAGNGSRIGGQVTASGLPGGLKPGSTVLVADDEAMIGKVCAEIFQHLGLSPLVTSDGEEAVRVFEMNRDRISLVLVDLSMPRMDGLEAARRIHALSPETPIILSSGYDEKETAEKFSSNGLAGFIQKPYTVGGMRAVLEKSLARQS